MHIVMMFIHQFTHFPNPSNVKSPQLCRHSYFKTSY